MDFFLEPRALAYSVGLCKGLSNLPHLHRHMEIVYMRKGTSWAYADAKKVLLEEGNLYIAFPNQIHYYLDQPGEHDLLLIIASPDLCPEFTHDFKNTLPVLPIYKRANDNRKIVTALENIAQSHADNTRFSDTEIKGNLMILLSELLKQMPMENRKKYDSTLLSDILLYCYDHFTEDISLHTLAEALHVSHYYISHIFNENLRIGFRDYINSLRIEKACELLKGSDSSITDIAFAVGFNSIRTFNRSFRKAVKLSPSQYQETIRA